MAQLSLMGSAASFGCFLAWGEVPGSVMSLVVLPGRAGLLVVPGLWASSWVWRLPTDFGDVPGYGGCCQLGGETSGFGGVSVCVRCMLLALDVAARCGVQLVLGFVPGYGCFCQGLRVISGLGVLLGWKLFNAGSVPVEATPWICPVLGLGQDKACPCRSTSQCIL